MLAMVLALATVAGNHESDDRWFDFVQEEWVWNAGTVRNLSQVLPPDAVTAVRALGGRDYDGRATAAAYLATRPDRMKCYAWGLFYSISCGNPEVRSRCTAGLQRSFICSHCLGARECQCDYCWYDDRRVARGYPTYRHPWGSFTGCRHCHGHGNWLSSEELEFYFDQIPRPGRPR